MEVQQLLPFEVSLQVLSYADGPYTDGSTCEQQVANLQRAELADVGDDFIHLEQHVCRVSALHGLSVNVQMEVQVLYVRKLLGGDEGSQYGRVVKSLAQFPRKLPWELCKGFDDSAVLGTFVPTEKFADIQDLHFHLDIDGQTVQRGHTADMLFKVDEIIAYVSQFCTLKIGDLLFTGTPVGVGPVSVGQHLQGYLEGEKLLDFHVR